MAYSVEVSEKALKSLKKLDKMAAKRIYAELCEIGSLVDPKSRGKALVGNLAGLWRYRVGDYRIICDIDNGKLIVLVIDIAHPREVYRGR